MRVSWLLPFRNAERWISDAVASMLLDSTDQDEIILVDDGSTDSGIQQLPSDSRIRLLQQPPLGITAALEKGRQAAQGRWIARLDADDISLPGRIDAQIRFLEENPEVAVVGGQAELFETPSPGQGMRLYVDWVNGLTDLHRELLVESPLFHPAVCMRAEAIQAVGGYRDGPFPEDYDLWLRLVSAGHRLANLPVPVVQIRDRDSRLTRTDPRYSKAGFRMVRCDFLQFGPLQNPQRVVVWGGKKGARPWLQWLAKTAHELVAVIDIVPGTERGGRPLLPPEALATLDFDVLLVSVGRRGARELIRRDIQRIRPDLREGVDWWALL